MRKIGIIGGGFTGTMTAVQLIKKYHEPLELLIINERESFNRGIAYNPYSDKHLLNVMAGKMSAFADQPDHFLDWIMARPDFCHKDREIVGNAFLSRKLYGDYLSDIWSNALAVAESRNIKVTVIESHVLDLVSQAGSIVLWLGNEAKHQVDDCVIATGNHIPGNPEIENTQFFQSSMYFQNPWQICAVKDLTSHRPILIIGNGLTMVDTVLGLVEQGFRGQIFSISPNGFNILPHRHGGLKYTKLIEELKPEMTIYELLTLIRKHIRSVRELGISAEPVIDSLRSHTQSIWKNFSEKEKKIFMSRLRHLWGVARHRIPLHTYDKIQKLRLEGRLHIRSGKIIDLRETVSGITTEYFDKKDHILKTLEVSRVINCTGPETDLMKVEQNFLKNCLLKGMISQDALKLGIRTDIHTYRVIDAGGHAADNLFTIGLNLKGELWESTAVNELRYQAEQLAEQLTAKEIHKVRDFSTSGSIKNSKI